MPIRKRVNWVISSLGLLSIFLSLAFVITTTSYAEEGCSATASCSAGSAKCDCPSGGTCNGGNGFVQCICNNPTESSSGTCDPILP